MQNSQRGEKNFQENRRGNVRGSNPWTWQWDNLDERFLSHGKWGRGQIAEPGRVWEGRKWRPKCEVHFQMKAK
jgi:hypothetical protein